MVEFVTKREVARKPNHRERNLRRELEWITARYDCGAMSDAVFGHAKRLETDLSLDPASGAAVSVDWKQAALDAWHAPSWREAAVRYHKDRPPAPSLSPDDKLTPSPREIWRAAGQCIRRKAPHNALRTFLRWCDYSGVDRGAALPIFKTIVEKELAK